MAIEEICGGGVIGARKAAKTARLSKTETAKKRIRQLK